MNFTPNHIGHPPGYPHPLKHHKHPSPRSTDTALDHESTVHLDRTPAPNTSTDGHHDESRLRTIGEPITRPQDVDAAMTTDRSSWFDDDGVDIDELSDFDPLNLYLDVDGPNGPMPGINTF